MMIATCLSWGSIFSVMVNRVRLIWQLGFSVISCKYQLLIKLVRRKMVGNWFNKCNGLLMGLN